MKKSCGILTFLVLTILFTLIACGINGPQVDQGSELKQKYTHRVLNVLCYDFNDRETWSVNLSFTLPYIISDMTSVDITVGYRGPSSSGKSLSLNRDIGIANGQKQSAIRTEKFRSGLSAAYDIGINVTYKLEPLQITNLEVFDASKNKDWIDVPYGSIVGRSTFKANSCVFLDAPGP